MTTSAQAFYVIMERNPYPGVYEPMPLYLIQQAELALGIGRHYHDGSMTLTPSSRLYLHPYDRARRIVEYVTRVHPYSEHYLFAYHKPLVAFGGSTQERGS